MIWLHAAVSCASCVLCGVFGLMAGIDIMPEALYIVFTSNFIADEPLCSSQISLLRNVSKPVNRILLRYCKEHFDYLREVRGWPNLRFQARYIRR